jgi:16S rRNA (cytosine967-C5)-methyltransferase
LVGRLAGEVKGRTVADLCAAPGGKTAALAARGALVTAVDISAARLERLKANLERLKLRADAIAADAASWAPTTSFDAVILDAPCTATGTIRRHPDILRLKTQDDIARMAALQQRLLGNAASMVATNGQLIYATCSLEPEEGAEQIARFLACYPGFERLPIEASEIGGEPGWITQHGELRTLPFHLQEGTEAAGMDGFYVARLRRRA